MILKYVIIILAILFIYLCVRILVKSAKTMNQIEDVPAELAEDLDRPRSQLLKTIQELRAENAKLRSEISDLKNR